RGIRCRERLKLKPEPRNINRAATLKARIEHEISTGEFDYRKHFPDSPRAKFFARVPGDNVTVASYLERWLEAEKQNIKPSTRNGYEKILKYSLVPAFGTLALTELKRKHIWEW